MFCTVKASLENGCRSSQGIAGDRIERQRSWFSTWIPAPSSPSESPIQTTAVRSSITRVEEPLRVPPRREYVWRSLGRSGMSFAEISRQFSDVLQTSFPSPSGLPLRRVGGRDAANTHHRCRGYTREEITLTTNLIDSAVVTFTTPAPQEICAVCRDTVQEGEIFDCVCRGSGELQNNDARD